MARAAAAKPAPKTRAPKARTPKTEVDEDFSEDTSKAKGPKFDMNSFMNDSLGVIAKRQGFESSGLDVSPPISCGLLELDMVLGGGIRPCMMTGAGGEQSAKTTMALTAMGAAINADIPLIAFIDFEGCWTEDTILGYGKGKYAPVSDLFDLSGKKSWTPGTWPGQTRTDIDTYESGHANRGTGTRTADLFYRGRKPTFQVETNLGVTLRGYRHKMLVVRGAKLYMKFMEELHVGEHVLVAKTALPNVEEQWRPVVGFGKVIACRYEVSNLGRVRSLPYISPRTMSSKFGKIVPQVRAFPGKLLATSQTASGHLAVNLCVPVEGSGPTKVISQLVHRLVALAFLSKPPRKFSQVLHWNDDPSDNRVTNLHWGNDKVNSAERSLRGRAKSSHSAPEVSTSVIATIRKLRTDGLPRDYIAEKTGVSTWLVDQYCSHKHEGAYCDIDLEAALVHYELAAVTVAEPTGKKERVYDVSLRGVASDEIPHSIITNGIVTHNSTKNSKPYVHSILKGMGIKLTMDQVFGKQDPKTGKYVIPPRVRYRSEVILERFYDWLSEVLRELPDKRFVEGKWWLVFDDKNKNHKAKAADFVDTSMTRKYGGGLWVEAPDDKIQGLVFVDSYTAMNPECKDEESISNQLSVKASAFSKQIERVKGRMAQKMVTIYGINHLRSNPMAMFGPKEEEKGGNALRQFSDVRLRHVSRSLSAAPFKPKTGKGTFDEQEPSVEFEGASDTYRYVNIKANKNKLWTPNRSCFIRIWVEDGNGVARGIDPVFDTVSFLKSTGQLSGTRAGFKLDLGKLGKAKKPIPWSFLKKWVLGSKEEMSKISQALGYKPMSLRAFCFKQIRTGEAEELYVAHKRSAAKGGDGEGDE